MRVSAPKVLGSAALEKSGTAALAKCLALFQRIATDGGRTPVTMLAKDLALPRATLYRMTAALERAGMIARISPGHFSIGFPLVENLAGVSAKGLLVEASRNLLRRLAAACGATAHLGVMENDMVTYLVKETGTRPGAAAVFTRENAQLEAYCSGIGKVLLAWLPADEKARYLAGGPFVALTERTITAPEALSACLEMVREKKFARDDGEIAENLFCLAVPVWTVPPMTAAISLSFERRLTTKHEKYLGRLRATAAAISRKLGSIGTGKG